MTPEVFKNYRNLFGLSQSQMADLLGVKSDRTIRKWEDGENDIAGPAIVALGYMLRDGITDDEETWAQFHDSLGVLNRVAESARSLLIREGLVAE